MFLIISIKFFKLYIFLATLSTSKNNNHSRSKSSTLPVSGRTKPSTLNIHHNNNTLISSSLSSQNNNQNKTNINTTTNLNNNLTINDTASIPSNTARKVPNKSIDNKNNQNKQLKLKLKKPTNFNGVLTDNSATEHRFNNKKTAESK